MVDAELGATAVIDPDAFAVPTPVAAFVTVRAGGAIDQIDAVAMAYGSVAGLAALALAFASNDFVVAITAITVKRTLMTAVIVMGMVVAVVAAVVRHAASSDEGDEERKYTQAAHDGVPVKKLNRTVRFTLGAHFRFCQEKCTHWFSYECGCLAPGEGWLNHSLEQTGYALMTVDASVLNRYLSAWHLVPDGNPIITPRAHLLPVRKNGEPAMLKVATDPEERFGGILLDWWGGTGAARVFEVEGDAILMERAMGARSLTAYAHNGHDDEATEILCDAMAALHTPRGKPLPDHLVTLPVWFKALEPMARSHGGWLPRAATEAHALLAEQRDVDALHGDIHHDNVLDFGERGWLAIDPKHIVGERGFDYANLFCNPDMDYPERPVAVVRERFLRRLEIVVERSGLERRRLLQWIVAWTGLSAAWLIDDDDDAEVDEQVAAMAIAELDR